MPPYESINRHPSNFSVSELKERVYDIVCIGSGWSGRVVASRVKNAGLSIVIIEEELLGGECPFWACVPSKALLRPQDAFEEAKVVRGLKERINTAEGLDAKQVFERRDTYAHHYDDGDVVVPMVLGFGAAIVRGTGSLIGVKKVAVDSLSGERIELEARYAVIVGTGSDPIIPRIPGLAEAKPWVSRNATCSGTAPEHLIILGGGVLGCEMATAYASLGSKVSLVCKQPEVLSKLDPEVGQIVGKSFVSRGIDLYSSTEVEKVTRENNGTVKVEISGGKIINGTEILVTTGRMPRTTGVGLEKFNIKTDGSPIVVDEGLVVDSVPGGWLYAVGDVNGRATLTHSCKYHGRIVANSIIAKARGAKIEFTDWNPTSATADRLALPQVVFSNPEVASVGLTRTAAKAAEKSVRIVTAPVITLGAMLRTEGFEKGWAQWVIEEGSEKLLGATFVGQSVADLLHASTVAIVGGMTVEQMSHAIPSFPTMSEVYLNLIEAAGY